MANKKCVFLGVTGSGLHKYCTSKKHPMYNKSRKLADFGPNAPDSCFNGGKGCPIFKKESK